MFLHAVAAMYGQNDSLPVLPKAVPIVPAAAESGGGSIALQVNLPELVPPTPDAAALIRVGMGALNKSTGAVTVNVPLYELKLHELSLPIGLSYSSQGFKVDEACSRVGSGWAFNAGGVITRSVLGRPDEFNNRAVLPANQNDLTALTSDNYYLFNNASNEDPTATFDAQPDEFRFNFGGYSGKFVLDAGFNAVVIAHSNLKVKVMRSYQAIDSILITTPDGIRYAFGGNNAVETTLGTNMRYKTATKTAFYLHRITLPSGESVQLYYSTISTQSNAGFTESYVLGMGGGTVCGSCPELYQFESHTTLRQYITYRTVLLTGIYSPDGHTINFQYSPRLDQTNEYFLDGMTVAEHGQQVKSYAFRYFVRQPATLNLNGLFFLTSLVEFGRNRGSEPELPVRDSLVHAFNYYDMALSGGNYLSADHFGFYNGANNETAIPAFPEYPDRAGANREFSFEHTQRGVLQKIIYPTGGTEEFLYEPNSLKVVQSRDETKEFVVSKGGQGTNHTNYSTARTPYVRTFTPVRTEQIPIVLKSFIRTNYTGTTYAPSSGTKVAFFKITDVTTNQVVANNTLITLQQVADQLNAVAGHTYSISLETRGPEYIHAHAILTYHPNAITVTDTLNKPTGGLRLKAIRKYDPVARKTANKYYTYGSLQDMRWSSGIGQFTAPYRSTSQSISQGTNTFCYQICEHLVYSASSGYNLFNFDGSHIYYTHVIESDDPEFRNGGMETRFYGPNSGNAGLLLRGQVFPGPTGIRTATLNGMTYQEKIFDKDFKVRTEKTYNYGFVSSGDRVPGLMVKRNYEAVLTQPLDEWDFHPFDVVYYLHEPGWIQLQSVVNKTITDVNGEMQEEETYGYGGLQNVNVSSVTTVNSRQETVVIRKKFATDFAGDLIADQMISRNMIDPVWEESMTNQSEEVARKVITYQDYFQNGKVIRPQSVKLKQSPGAALTTELVFSAYDELGNIREAYKQDNIPVVYLWNEWRSKLLAKVENALLSQVAYSSFEGTAADSWQCVGNIIAGGLTGSKAYSGQLTRQVPQGNYVVTLWSTGTTATVNGTTGVLMNTAGNWQLLEWKLNNINTVTVTGNSLDEVRLYPSNAVMTSFAYTPAAGLASQCDANNQVLSYVYDDFNRVVLVRDLDQYVLKQYQYVYGEPLPACASTSANWVATGVKRCASNSNNNNTGIEEQEEVDRNNCSVTYLQVRWVSMGITGNCVVVPNCTGEDKKVINGVCYTGQKLFTGEGTYDKNTGVFSCQYYYLWGIDNSQSVFYNQANSTPCFQTVPWD